MPRRPNELYNPVIYKRELLASILDKLYWLLSFVIIAGFALFPESVVWIWQQMFDLLDLLFASQDTIPSIIQPKN